ncbi:MAG: DUF3035 domain-containing protein [Pseudomonadota bacterium]
MTRIFVLLSLFVLTGCEGTREQFDFSKKAPDEFAITTRAPLEMPSDLGALPPPRPGAPRPQETATDLQARQAIFGAEKTGQTQIEGASISSGENRLLQKAGADQASSDIRNIVDAETDELVKENTPTFDRILGKMGNKIDTPATVVDPVGEVERIRVNQETGKPITEGETPTIEE